MGTRYGWQRGARAPDQTSCELEILESRWMLSGTGRHHAAAPPAAPTQLTATPSSGTQIKLNWVDNASNETSYVVLRKTSKHGKYVAVATLPANSIYFRNRGLTAGQNYWYAVEAVSAAGVSAAPVAFTTTPAATSTPPQTNPAVGAIALDRSFGGTGEAVDSALGAAERIGVQPNGKIVVLASATGGGEVLRRYNTDGTRDMSFGTSGQVTLRTDPNFGPDRGMIVEADGKIVFAAAVQYNFSSIRLTPTSAIFVYRFNADGSPDPTFGTDGVVQGPDVAAAPHSASDVAVGADGKIVVAGSDGTNFVAYRFTASGASDATFGTGGAVSARVGSSAVNSPIADAVAIDPNDGSLVVVGTNTGSSQFLQGHVFSLEGRKISPTGAVTASFSVRDNGAHQYHPGDLAVQSDGRIVVASSYGDSEADLFRFTADGTFDKTFKGNTLGSPAGGGGAHGYQAVLPLAGGSFVAGGFAYATSANSDFLLTRVSAGGAIDPTAGGTGGVVTTDKGAADESITSLALEPDGSIIAAGGSGGHLVLWRYRTS